MNFRVLTHGAARMALTGLFCAVLVAGCAHQRQGRRGSVRHAVFRLGEKLRDRHPASTACYGAPASKRSNSCRSARPIPSPGVILSDWYSAPDVQNERVKVEVFILGRDLRADTLRVSVFRQVRNQTGALGRRPTTQPGTADKIEDAILTMARQLRLREIDNG